MITIPILTEKDLNFFKGNKVLLYGEPQICYLLYKIFRCFGIKVIGYSANTHISPKHALKNKISGLFYLKPNKFEKIIRENSTSGLIIQIAAWRGEKIIELQNDIKDKNAICSPFDSSQIINSFARFIIFNEMKNPVRQLYKKLNLERLFIKIYRLDWFQFQRKRHEDPIVICSPAKTADYTLNNTFSLINEKAGFEKVEYINLFHQTKLINVHDYNRKHGKLKMIVGVREPISQNLSALYQEISGGTFYMSTVTIAHETAQDKACVIENYEDMLVVHANDVQVLWDVYLATYNKLPLNSLRMQCLIQRWFEAFEKHILDITAYPFDQEKGYSIVKEDQIEIFVYQLEKLNKLIPELSTWVGVPFDKLENANEANDKWIGKSYKQAQREIEFTQEYFDKCYNEPYVKHCYSEADIEKFKEKWRPHIKNSKTDFAAHIEI